MKRLEPLYPGPLSTSTSASLHPLTRLSSRSLRCCALSSSSPSSQYTSVRESGRQNLVQLLEAWDTSGPGGRHASDPFHATTVRAYPGVSDEIRYVIVTGTGAKNGPGALVPASHDSVVPASKSRPHRRVRVLYIISPLQKFEVIIKSRSMLGPSKVHRDRQTSDRKRYAHGDDTLVWAVQ